jgi:hypothetical protein
VHNLNIIQCKPSHTRRMSLSAPSVTSLKDVDQMGVYREGE